jgi:hypothetical protein
MCWVVVFPIVTSENTKQNIILRGFRLSELEASGVKVERKKISARYYLLL